MKIAVLSDIHGNIEALNAVIKHIKAQNIEKIFLCGDLAMAGPEPSETIEAIKQLQQEFDITIIQGNTDEMIVKSIFPPNTIMTEALKYSIATISDTQKDFLAALPTQKSIKIGELSILLVHGSPRKNNEDIMPGEPIEKIEEMLKGTSEDLIFCGHTHIPAGYQTHTKQTVVNVGSVGRPFSQDPKACYVTLDIIDEKTKQFTVEHNFIKYDANTAAEKLRQQKFEGADKLADMLISATSRYPQ